MKKIIMATVIILYFTITCLAAGAIRKTSAYKIEFKRALDAATDAAVNRRIYEHSGSLEGLSFGYGIGYENKGNIPVYKADALKWFYRILFKNIGIEHDTAAQDRLKGYIPMKCLILFDRLEIADANDAWIVEKQYIIERGGTAYLFTLTDDVQNMSNGSWLKASALGISEAERKRLVTNLITKEVNKFLYEHSSKGTYFEINIGADGSDLMHSSINGINFIVFIDKMPLQGMNFFNPKETFTVFSIGGSELYRD